MSPAKEAEAEQQVLLACLDEVGRGEKQVVGELTGCDFTGRGEESIQQTTAFLEKALRGLLPDTLADFVAVNRVRVPVRSTFRLDDRFIILTQSELDALFQNDQGWERFRTLYPRSYGVLDVSQVGLNILCDQALIYTGLQVDWEMGHGEYRLFEKSGGRWEQTESALAWMS
jgi:hypothetical protein